MKVVCFRNVNWFTVVIMSVYLSVCYHFSGHAAPDVLTEVSLQNTLRKLVALFRWLIVASVPGTLHL